MWSGRNGEVLKVSGSFVSISTLYMDEGVLFSRVLDKGSYLSSFNEA